MDFTGVIAKINPFIIFTEKFIRPFSVKISYEHAAP
jgi:hypothetical protein